MTFVDGVDYVTTSEAIERLGSDITPDTIRGWVRMGKLTPSGRHPGGESVFRWEDVDQAEYDTRISTFGRPRQKLDASANMTITGLVAMANGARNPHPTCTVRPDRGNECGQDIPAGAPISVCKQHMHIAEKWLADTLAAKATAQVAPAGIVYYLRFGDRIKIGTTTNLRNRLQSLPHDEVLVTEPGDRDLEQMRHAQFGHARVSKRGEWFHMHPDLMSHIDMLTKHYSEAHAA